MHGEAADLMAKIRRNDHYRPRVADPLSPITFVDKIDVPVFMACQFTDEQTGGHCPTLAEHLTGTDKKWITFTNGTHVDSLAPETFNRLYDFLQLYVARQAPITNSAVLQASAPVVFQAAFGIDGLTLPPDPIQQQPTYEGALAAFERAGADPDPVRQRRRRLEPRRAVSRLRAVFPELPDPRHHRPLLVSRTRRRPRRHGARRCGCRSVHLGRRRTAADRLQRRHRRRRERPLDRNATVRVDTGPRRQRSLLRHSPAERHDDRDRRRGRACLGPLLEAERRPPGHDQRGPARRHGDLRPGRLGARQHAQARQAQEHAARARPQPPAVRHLAAAARPFRQGRRSRSTTRGTSIARARASASGSAPRTATSRSGRSARPGPRDKRPWRSVTATTCPRASSSRRCRGQRADRTAAVPGSARGAVPRVRAVREQHDDSLTLSRSCRLTT